MFRASAAFGTRDSIEITWITTETCGAIAKIELLCDGVSCLTIDDNADNDGSYIWEAQVVDSQPTGYAIRVTDLDSGDFDDSDVQFMILPSCAVSVTHPNGGESFSIGESLDISWDTSSCCGDSVLIELLRNDTPCDTITASTENDGLYDWNADQCESYSTGYAVRISDFTTGKADASDATFTIVATCAITVTAPGDEDSWTEGEEIEITWNVSGGCGNLVRIELLHDGEVCQIIASETDNDGSHDWTAQQCSNETSGYAIRVTDIASEASDDGEGSFSILEACVITVTDPSPGEEWIVGEIGSITWESEGECGDNVKIELLREGIVCHTIETSTPNDGAHDWTAAKCDGHEADYSVRVTDLASSNSGES